MRALAAAALACTACSSPGIVTGYPLAGVVSGTEILAVKDGDLTELFVYALAGQRIHTELAPSGRADLDLEAEIFDQPPSALGLRAGKQTVAGPGEGVADLPDAKALCRLRIRSGLAEGSWTCSSSAAADRRTFRIAAPPPCFTIEKWTFGAEPQRTIPLDPLAALRSGNGGRVLPVGYSVYLSYCPLSSSPPSCSATDRSTFYIAGRNAVAPISTSSAPPGLAWLAEEGMDVEHFAAVSADGASVYERTGKRTSIRLAMPNLRALVFTSTDGSAMVGVVPGAIFGVGAEDLVPRWRQPTADTVRGLARWGGHEIMAASDRGIAFIGFDGRGYRFRPFEASIDGTRIGQLSLARGAPTSPVLAASQGARLALGLSDPDAGGEMRAMNALVLHDGSTGQVLEGVTWSLAPMRGNEKINVVAFTTHDERAFVALFDPATMRFLAPPQPIGAGPIERLTFDFVSDLWTALPWSSEIVHLALASPGCL